MLQDRLFDTSEIALEDVVELTSALDDINTVCAQFYFIHGMTDATKLLINAFYKLRIRILEIAVRTYEELKSSHEYTLSNPDHVLKLGQHQAELEEAKGDYEYFKEYEKIRE
jgi:hypothetical protein